MGNRTDSYFYISGLISLLFFVTLLFLAMKTLFTPTTLNSFAMKKDTYISISLDMPKVPSKKVEKAEEPSAHIEKSVAKPKNIDVNNLFSDVWTKKIVHKVKPLKPKDIKRILDIQKKIETTKENDVKSLSQRVSDAESKKKKSEKQATSTAEQVNEYLAKIQAIVYQYFHVPQNSQGSSVKAVIELDALGKLIDFRVLNYSINEALNHEADLIKERLMYVVFPENPKHISSKTIVILTSKE